METKTTFIRSMDWQILSNEGKEWYLEKLGQPKSKIIIDEVIKILIETADSCSIDELYQKNADLINTALEQVRQENNVSFPVGSREFLQKFYRVFTQVGVLLTGNEKIISPKKSLKTAEDSLYPVPLVSVVIVTWNGIEHLPELLNSLKQQDYPHLEIIVVDNHSEDNSFSFIKENFPGIIICRNPKNFGHGAAFNIGLEKAKGNMILHLDDDIVLKKETISQLVYAALAKKKWAALAPKIKFYHNPAFINSMGNSINDTDWGSDNFINHVDLGQFDHFNEPFSACFASVLLNKETIKTIGDLDEFYMVYYDDVDWCYRAQLNGFPIYIVPEAEAFHKFGGTMKKNEKFYRRKWKFIISNRLYFTIKNFEIKTITRLLIRYLQEDLKNMGGCLVKGKFSLFFIYCRAYARFLSALPRVLQKRKEVQKQRTTISDALLFSKNVPINRSVSKKGIPRLDMPSLCFNYFLSPLTNDQ